MSNAAADRSEDPEMPALRIAWFRLVLFSVWGIIIGAVVGWLDRSPVIALAWGLAGMGLGLATVWLEAVGDWLLQTICNWYEEWYQTRFDPGADDRLHAQLEAIMAANEGQPTSEADAEVLAAQMPEPFGVLLCLPVLMGSVGGILIGPLLGLTLELEMVAWQRSLIGLIIGPPLVAVICSVACVFVYPLRTVPVKERLLILLSLPLAFVAAVEITRAVTRRPWQKRLVREFESRGADVGCPSSKFGGINFRQGDFRRADFARLRWFPKLSSLNLSGTAIDDDGLLYVRKLRRLELLNLDDTAIGDKGLSHLVRLQRLRILTLRHTQVSPQRVAELQRRLPRCKICVE